jgi:hypothetical protein
MDSNKYFSWSNIKKKNGIKYYIIEPGSTFYRADNPIKQGNTVVYNSSIVPGNPEKKFDERTFDSPPSSPVNTSNTEKNKLPIFPYLFFSPSYESIEANYGKKPIFEIKNTKPLKLIALDLDQEKLFEQLKDEQPDLSNNEITDNIIMKNLDPIKNNSIKQLLVDHFAFNEDGIRNTAKCRLSVPAVDKFMAIYFSNGIFQDFDGYGCNLITCHDLNDHFHSEFTIKETRNKIDVIGIVSKNKLSAPSIKGVKAPPSSRKRNIPPPTPNNLSYSSSKKGSRPSILNLDLNNEFETLNMNTPSKKRNTLFRLENNLNSSFDSRTNLDTMFDSPTSPVRVRGGKKKKTHKNKRKTKKSRKSSRKTKRKTKKRRC